MNAVLLGRAHGTIGPQSLQRYKTARLLHGIQPAPSVGFDGTRISVGEEGQCHSHKRKAQDVEVFSKPAHPTGVNALAIDNQYGRFMLSGGADSSILLWDLEDGLPTSRNHVHRPKAAAKKSSSTHKNGITHLSYYQFEPGAFEPGAFFSSSYDHTVKIWDARTLTVVGSYDLENVVYSHDVSPIAERVRIACATQSPLVRLVDPVSRDPLHSLAGHQGAVLSVAWSPRNENVLASGGSDGVVRLWDIRKAAASLGVLDLDDTLGFEESRRLKDKGKSHAGACNGVRWSEDGNYIISVGRDEQVRVWDANTGANTLAHFGSMLKNPHSATTLPLIIPSHISTVGQRIMIYPNGRELLMYDVLEGTLLKRLQVLGTMGASQDLKKGRRNIHHRITALSFRTSHVEIYTAHLDGRIRLWAPRTLEDADLDEEEAQESRKADEVDERQKKRQELDQVFRELAKRPFTFS